MDKSNQEPYFRANANVKPCNDTNLPPHFKIPNVPDEFMYSGATVESCNEIIDELLRMRVDQQRLDELYQVYVDVCYNEMKSFFKEVSSTPK